LSWIWICLKKQAELLGFGLNLWNLLRQHTDICFFHNCQNEFKQHYPQGNDLVFWNDLCSLIDLSDSSKVSLKAMLLHDGNKFPSAPLARSAKMRVLWKYENTFGKDPVWKI
jgi:hypothetical protein